ncbi:MAG TPA: 50S ribosomal protein L9 [Nitrospiria bacterium]|jgi:large subunit ribosomal protein L9
MKQVILKEEIENLGKSGDLVNVAEGYARNFLLPRFKAVEATPKNLKRMEHEKRLIQDQLKKDLKGAHEQAAAISAISITIPVQVGEEGKLFGSVSTKDLVEELSKQGINIDKRQIQLEKPLKELGQTAISVKVHQEITATLNVTLIKA